MHYKLNTTAVCELSSETLELNVHSILCLGVIFQLFLFTYYTKGTYRVQFAARGVFMAVSKDGL